MADSQRKVLEMLAENKVSVDEAARLLALVKDEADASETREPSEYGPKYLRVVVTPRGDESGSEVERVNIRVPMALIRAGIKLTALLPSNVSGQVSRALAEKGIDLDLRTLKAEDLEPLVDALNDLEVDVESGKEKVRIYAE